MRALFVTSECHPLIKTGGLADVSAALPAALAEHGIDIRVMMPGYPEALDRADHVGQAVPLRDVPGDEVWKGLVERSVLVRNCASWPRLDGCLRVTIGTTAEDDVFLASLREVLA